MMLLLLVLLELFSSVYNVSFEKIFSRDQTDNIHYFVNENEMAEAKCPKDFEGVDQR